MWIDDGKKKWLYYCRWHKIEQEHRNIFIASQKIANADRRRNGIDQLNFENQIFGKINQNQPSTIQKLFFYRE